MNELSQLKNERAVLKLVASCSTKFDEYLKIIEKTGISLDLPQRIELYIFCAFVPYLTVLTESSENETQNSPLISFMSALLEYKPENLTEQEFELMIDAQENGEEGATVLDYIHAYYESWVDSLSNQTIQEEKRLTHAVSGLHIKLTSRLAYLSDEYQDLEDQRFEAMRNSKLTEMMSIMKEQSSLEDSYSSKYMTQIHNLMTLTFNHLNEVSTIVKE